MLDAGLLNDRVDADTTADAGDVIETLDVIRSRVEAYFAGSTRASVLALGEAYLNDISPSRASEELNSRFAPDV